MILFERKRQPVGISGAFGKEPEGRKKLSEVMREVVAEGIGTVKYRDKYVTVSTGSAAFRSLREHK